MVDCLLIAYFPVSPLPYFCMQRFSRQLAGPSTVTRAFGPEKLARTRNAVSNRAIMARRYTSSSNDRFGKLFALLQGDLKEDRLARVVAALEMSTRDKERRSMILDALKEHFSHVDKKQLDAQVYELLQNPPKDIFNSLLGSGEYIHLRGLKCISCQM